MQRILEIENWKIFEDESNETDLYLRNRLRKTILPILKQEGLNPNKLHENFHNRDDLFPDESENSIQKVIPSFLKIDCRSLENINVGNLKLLIDAYASILKIHPFSRKILLELKKELEKNTSFLVENKEVMLWKSPTSDLFLIPSKSQALQKPKLLEQDKTGLLLWNGKTKEYSLDFHIGSWKKGIRIQKNAKHLEVSELLREKHIPGPVRQFIPILFKENQVSAILFSLWDDKIRDFIGD